MKKLTHASNVIYGTPWMMESGWFNLVCGIFESHLAGKIPVQIQEKQQRAEPQQQSGVAVLGIYGPILPRAALMGNVSTCGISSEQIANAVKEASMMDGVDTIVLDVDTPGGSTIGAFEAADTIRDVAQNSEKEVIASINGIGASLGYLLASQANQVFASRGSRVGSIGVVSAYQEKTEPGVTRSIVVAVPHSKSPHNMDDAEISERMMDDAMRYFVMFKDQINSTRAGRIKMDEAATGEVFFAEDALRLGLIDGVGTLSDVLESLKK